MTLSAPLSSIKIAFIEWQDVATLLGGFYPLFGLLCLCWSLHLFRQNLAQRNRLRQFALTETSNRTRLRELLDSVSDLVFILTREGRILELNKAAERIFGEKTGSISGASSPVAFWFVIIQNFFVCSLRMEQKRGMPVLN